MEKTYEIFSDYLFGQRIRTKIGNSKVSIEEIVEIYINIILVG